MTWNMDMDERKTCQLVDWNVVTRLVSLHQNDWPLNYKKDYAGNFE